jgi:hypothetical protein
MRAPSLVSVLWALVASLSSSACGDGGSEQGPTWLDDPLAAYPARLSEVGLYPDLQDVSRVSARALAYEPAWPLWSNGSDKTRHVVLPADAMLDAGESPWSFPVGTVFFKTFAFEDGPVETRLLRITEDDVDYATYLWDEEGDAILLDGRTATEVRVRLDGDTFEHEVPSHRQCRECHESAAERVLGFNAWQLDAEQLDALQDAFEMPPSSEPIEHDERATREVMGYVAANCAHCHNAGSGSNNAFDLRPNVFLDNTIERETESSAAGEGVRIVPGDADRSVLYLALTGQDNGTGIDPMPPLGVQRRDQDAAMMIAEWIDGL